MNTPYRSATFCYMTGTGNTFRTTSWSADHARDGGLEVRLLPIDRVREPVRVNESTTHLLGVFSPTHGFTAPWAALRFVSTLPYGWRGDAFVVATRGGMVVGSWPVPGLEGTACYLVALLLALKGYRVRGALAVDMPVNWTAVHSALSAKKVELLVSRAKPKVEAFIGRILSGTTAFGGLPGLIVGLILLPISFLYLFKGSFFLAKLFFADGRCTRCGLCAKTCPFGAIHLREGRPYWTLHCESCMRCMTICPTQAVQAGHSWCVLLACVSSFSFSAFLVGKLEPSTLWNRLAQTRSWWWITDYLYFLSALATTYAAFWFLIRLQPLNALFAYTTFTRLFRRYHEPGTSLIALAPRQSQPAAAGRDLTS